VPIKSDVDHDARLIRFELQGELETAEMLAAVDDVLRRLDGRKGYDFLSDNRQLTKPATPAQIKPLMSRLAAAGDTVTGAQCAVIVGQEASYGMMRLMAAHAEPLGIRVGVFWNMEDALRFLGPRDGGEPKR
jgi:hypothetical protein